MSRGARFKDYYVYALVDPRTNEPFYIGKGKGWRCYTHLPAARRGNGHNGALMLRLQDLWRCGLLPTVRCLAEGLTESAAFERESSEISSTAGLTNIAPGAGSSDERHERFRQQAKAIIRKMVNIRHVPFRERVFHCRMLKELAGIIAYPTVNVWAGGKDSVR